MFKSVRLVNFFSFEDEKIDLHQGVNLLVGINGSGKSNLLRAFELLEAGMRQQLAEKVRDWGGFEEILFKGLNRKGDREEISLEFELEQPAFQNPDIPTTLDWKNLVYKISLSKKVGGNFRLFESLDAVLSEQTEFPGLPSQILNSTPNNSWLGTGQQVSKPETDELLLPQLGISAPPELAFIAELLKKEIAVYSYFNTFPDSPMRGTNKALGTKRLQNYGDNLVQILNTIKLQDRNSYALLIEKTKDLNPNFEGLDFRFLGSGVLEMLLEEKNLKSVIHSSSISDGTLRLICLASIAYNADRGKIICIDEPEMGLHPDMIVGMSHMLDHAVLDGAQLLIATHSPILLDLYQLENVWVLEKGERNSTHTQRPNEEEYEGWRESFEPGKMWRAGDIGGNRW